MAETFTETAASRLCQDCGLCCDGTIFHTVRLQPGDSAPALRALGLRLVRRHGRDCFLQPCAAFHGGRCTIYAQRPERCRRFECRQLRGVRVGEISEAAARHTIAEARIRAARLDSLSRRADGTLRKGPLAQRCETALAEPLDPDVPQDLVRQRQELAGGLAELDAMLDLHFRVTEGGPGAE